MATKVYLKKNEDKRIKYGHLWIFSNEIEKISSPVENGELVDVFNSGGEYIGTGFYNKNSLISVRILSRKKFTDLKTLFLERILFAYNLRKQYYQDRESFRLVFSESDFIPGLIIDKYNKSYVLQIYSYGIQKNVGMLIEILRDEFNAENIFSKNETYFRFLEGLPDEDEIYLGNLKSEKISDGAILYDIDFERGHKTGFYFDQSDNRFFIEKFCNGRSVVDAFCNSGGFGLHAIRAGAAHVSFIDTSGSEIENVKRNLLLNNFPVDQEFITGDVFEFFEDLIRLNKKYDIVMIDPPAFAKNKKSLPSAKKGYEKLNKLAMHCVNSHGYLITSSCSFHLKRDEFISLLNSAAVKAGKEIQQIHFNGASLDHPRLPAMDETSYLKFGIFRIL